jgi:hypothetical protein
MVITFFRVGAAVACLSVGLQAQAGETWHWRDASGRQVYSDRPPPASVAPAQILRRPDGASPAATQPSPTPRPGRLATVVPEQRSPEAAAIRADNCRGAQAAMATLESGVPLQMRNDRGEAVLLDAAMRVAEAARLRQILKDNCP